MPRSAPAQLRFEFIVEDSFRARSKAIDRYLDASRDKYLSMGQMIAPDLGNWTQVYSRAAFAILSANVPFDFAVKALAYVNRHKGDVTPRGIAPYGMVPAKANYVNAIPVGKGCLTWCRQGKETCHAHRLRLWKSVNGLGLCKASFLSALLEPLDADVACVDTHMQTVYLSTSGFKRLNLSTYLEVEAKVRQVAERHHIGTFIAQWAIWDHTRGSLTDHAVFPGTHKG